MSCFFWPSTEKYFILPVVSKETTASWFGFPLTLKKDHIRTKLIKELELNKIGTRLVFAGNMLKQPAMSGVNYKVKGDLSSTDKVMNNSFWVGIWPGLSEIHLDYISDKLKTILLKIW